MTRRYTGDIRDGQNVQVVGVNHPRLGEVGVVLINDLPKGFALIGFEVPNKKVMDEWRIPKDQLAPFIEIDDASGPADNAVNHPGHYGGGDNPYETIKVLRAWLTPEALRGFCLGNAIKYISRAGKKGSDKELEDLQKSAWYLQYAIKELHGE